MLQSNMQLANFLIMVRGWDVKLESCHPMEERRLGKPFWLSHDLNSLFIRAEICSEGDLLLNGVEGKKEYRLIRGGDFRTVYASVFVCSKSKSLVGKLFTCMLLMKKYYLTIEFE